jgi:phage gpG-like protein
VRVELDIFGDVQLKREILRWGDAAEDARPAFRSIVGKWTEWTRKQFDSQGRRASGGWKPITEEWRQYKQRRGFDTRILHMTQRLRASLTVLGHPDAVRDVQPDSLTWGTSVEYAPFHQHGNEPRLARRRPVELTKGDRAATVKVLQLWIARGRVV